MSRSRGKAHTAFDVDSSESFCLFLFMLRGLTVRLCVSMRERHDSGGEQNPSSLDVPS
ncbi:hypothetical protein ACRRTK_003874 [Alexandromys fortis]